MMLCSFFALLFSLAQGQGITEDGTYLINISASGSANIQYFQGPVISNAEVVIVKMGGVGIYCDTVTNCNDATSPTLQNQAPNSVAAWFINLFASKYVDWWPEYSFTSGSLKQVTTFANTTTVIPGLPQVPIDDLQIQTNLRLCISTGKCRPPTYLYPNNKTYPQTIYHLFFPTGMQVTRDLSFSCVDFCAYHSSFNYGFPYGQIVYAVFPDTTVGLCSTLCGGFYNNAPPTCDRLTKLIVSHELAEQVSDPLGNQEGKVGYTDPVNGENGDVCSGILGFVNDNQDLPVQYIYSRIDNACITTKDFTLTTTNSNPVLRKNEIESISVPLIVTQRGGSTQLIQLSPYVVPNNIAIAFTFPSLNHGDANLTISYTGASWNEPHSPLSLTIKGTGQLYTYYITYSVAVIQTGS